MIDLHIHTTASDGSLSPKEVIDKAIEKGITCLAITDHDTIDGLREAVEYAKQKDFDLILGVEIGYDDFESDISDIHIIGLGVDFLNKELIDACEELKKNRVLQKKEMVGKLNKLGYEITFEEVLKETTGTSIGRPHIARVLIKKYPGEFQDIHETFVKLLDSGKKAFVSQKKFSLQKVIQLINDAGGITILAHPGLCENDDEIIEKFIAAGGEGIEINYPYERLGKDERLNNKYLKIAEENGLLISGGSDFHSDQESTEIGSYGITKEQFEVLKKRLIVQASPNKI
ncbi:PHP domain-containing protein [Candidatus Pacearchaeota archaeon]|nr:PHP domain-containing protein [Candidatus Pacearchaeota archaeon]